MLDIAWNHREEIRRLYAENIMRPENRFYNNSAYYAYELDIHNTNWERLQMTSLDAEDRPLGYLMAHFDREGGYVRNIGAFRFRPEANPIFSRDLAEFIKKLFVDYDQRKIEWSVIIGNSAESIYDKFCARTGGRIVGTFHDHVRFPDGSVHDEKMYELFKEDFMSHLKASDKA